MKRKLRFFQHSGRTVVADCNNLIDGDYEGVARITRKRVIEWCDVSPALTTEEKSRIEQYALSAHPSVSTTQSEPWFLTPPAVAINEGP